jgi:hypothetical protein
MEADTPTTCNWVVDGGLRLHVLPGVMGVWKGSLCGECTMSLRWGGFMLPLLTPCLLRHCNGTRHCRSCGPSVSTKC